MVERLYRGLYRGKRIDNGEWVYGFYFCMYHDDDRKHLHHFIIPLNVSIPKDRPIGEIQVEVDPDSIGEYTGERDKNDKMVFTDCIVTDGFDNIRGIVRFGEYYNPVADGYHIGFYIEWRGKYSHILRKDLGYWAENFEVIGNIHDNPELLEGKL